MEIDLFREWLINDRGLKETSAKDVVSRLRRVDKIIEFNRDESYESIVESLDVNEEFNKFSTYVKPQVKRAIKLYKEFVEQK